MLSYIVAISLKNEIPGDAFFKSAVRKWKGTIHSEAKISQRSRADRTHPRLRANGHWYRNRLVNTPT